MSSIFNEYLTALGWAVTGAISMAISLAILLKIFSWLTPIDEWKEIREKNYAVAIIIAAVIIAFGIVVAVAILPSFTS